MIIEHPERIVPAAEYFDNRTQEFISIQEKRFPAMYLQLEHSLKSIAKWESKWHKAFAGTTLTSEEFIDYIRCMTINRQQNPDIYDGLTTDDLMDVLKYMEDPGSAYVASKKKKKRPPSKSQGTVEEIYYAMIQYGIPMECELWHFNRLIALISFCEDKGGSTSGAGGQKKRTERELLEMYRSMNERNRKKYNSKG